MATIKIGQLNLRLKRPLAVDHKQLARGVGQEILRSLSGAELSRITQEGKIETLKVESTTGGDVTDVSRVSRSIAEQVTRQVTKHVNQPTKIRTSS